MTKNNRAFVSPRKSGGWQSKQVGKSRASFTGSTQREVYNKQRNAFRNGKGGEISVQGLDGRIREKNTIKPMKDFCPPLG